MRQHLGVQHTPKQRRRLRLLSDASAAGLQSLPQVRVSAEFMDDFFAKFNIDPSWVTNKAALLESDISSSLNTDDVQGLALAFAEAVLSHIDVSLFRKAEAAGSSSDLFDERDDESVGDAAANGAAAEADSIANQVGAFLAGVVEELGIDAECLVIGLVLLERAVYKNTLILSARSWRRSTLVAIAVATKSWYDGAIYNSEMSAQLQECDVKQFNQMEASFLQMIDYDVNVPISLFAKYYFAMHDVMSMQRCSSGSLYRRSTWGAGDSTKSVHAAKLRPAIDPVDERSSGSLMGTDGERTPVGMGIDADGGGGGGGGSGGSGGGGGGGSGVSVADSSRAAVGNGDRAVTPMGTGTDGDAVGNCVRVADAASVGVGVDVGDGDGDGELTPLGMSTDGERTPVGMGTDDDAVGVSVVRVADVPGTSSGVSIGAGVSNGVGDGDGQRMPEGMGTNVECASEGKICAS